VKPRIQILPLLLLGSVLAVAGGAVVYSITASTKLPDGPFDVVWDKAACIACGMHVGEPPFAAQLTTAAGEQFAFDDPGCLFLYVEEHRPEVHSAFFRHHAENRWIPLDRVGFVRADKTPMGFGFAAVDTGTPGAVGSDEVRRSCLEQVGGHGGRR